MNDALTVVALGGNAISRKGEEGSIEQQFFRTQESAKFLTDLIEDGHRLVITHGNGPQVGNALRRVELAAREVYPIPLHLCVADTQATMGFMITQCLNNELQRRGMRDINANTVLTNVEIDPEDPAFGQPTKPIGRYLKRSEAVALEERHGWEMEEFDNVEFRRVVPSPCPKKIIQLDLIKTLVSQGHLLVVCGGGGIPVRREDNGDYIGVDCIIDKDRTAALLAAKLEASRLLIGTSVEHVMLDYRTSKQRPLTSLTATEAKQHLDEGHFPKGTMGPKVEAGVAFLENTPTENSEAIITDPENMVAAVNRQTGTRIIKGF